MHKAPINGITVELTLQPGGTTGPLECHTGVAGTIDAGGHRRPFVGWLELIAVLEDVLEAGGEQQ